jgi:predicted GH43/DUF377 family glycosyl hydrolase
VRQQPNSRFFKKPAALVNPPLQKPQSLSAVINKNRLENEIRGRNRSDNTQIEAKICDVSKAFKAKDLDYPQLVWLNNSIIKYGGRNLMAVRRESYPYWRNSVIGLCECDDSWNIRPKTGKILDLPGRRENSEAEDGRLLIHEDRLYLVYTDNRGQFLARLNSDLIPTWIQKFYSVEGLKITSQEKNWAFFSHWTGLYCIYSIDPHVVLKYDKSALKVFCHGTWPFDWNYGSPRGGVVSVPHKKMYWHWFHSSHSMQIGTDDCRWRGSKRYHLGVYVFDNKPPFSPIGYSKFPLLSGADHEEKHLPGVDRPSEHAVVFCCGAVRDELNSGWWISYGENDMRCKVAHVPDSVVMANFVFK